MVALTAGRRQMSTRLQQFSAVELETIAAEISMFAAQLQAVADEMKTRKLRGIPINGKNTPDRIKTELVRFVSNARDAIVKATYGM